LGTDAELDLDLAEFVYELADRVERLPGQIASEEVDRIRRQRRESSPLNRNLTAPALAVGRDEGVDPSAIISAGRSWTGMYDGTNRRFRLTIRDRRSDRFRASLEYLDDGAVTDVDGRIVRVDELGGDQTLKAVLAQGLDGDVGVTFQETRISKEGRRPVGLNGEYRAAVGAGRMRGVWTSNGRVLGQFQLEMDDSSVA
jgi:hypothetical protein